MVNSNALIGGNQQYQGQSSYSDDCMIMSIQNCTLGVSINVYKTAKLIKHNLKMITLINLTIFRF